MKKLLTCLLLYTLSSCSGLVAEAEDSLTALIDTSSLGSWTRPEPADIYNKDNVFQLINGEAELYFPYGLKRVVAGKYAKSGATDLAVSVEVYELNSPLDAFGVYSNYRDETSELTDVGTEGFAGSTQVMFYQDVFFVKARTDKAEHKKDLLQFCRELSDNMPQDTPVPTEPELLNVDGVLEDTRQYIAGSVLGYDFFERGFVAKAFAEKKPAEDAKPTRVFIIEEKLPDAAKAVMGKYTDYLDKNEAAYEWVEVGDQQVLKASDPLHKGVLLQQTGRYVVGVAKLAPETDGMPLLKRLTEKVGKKK